MKVSFAFQLDKEEGAKALQMLRDDLASRQQQQSGSRPTNGVESAHARRVLSLAQMALTDPMRHNGKVVPLIAHVQNDGGLGSVVSTSSADRTANLWRCLPGRLEPLASLTLDAPPVAVMPLGPLGPLLFSTVTSIEVVKVYPDTLKASHKIFQAGLSQLAVIDPSPSTGVLAASSVNKLVKIDVGASATNTTNVTAPVEFGAHPNAITCLRWSPSTKLLLSGDAKGLVLLWDPRMSSAIGSLGQPHTKTVTCLEDISSTYIVSGSGDGKLMVWDVRKLNAPFASPSIDGHPIINLRVSQDRSLAAVSTLKGVYCMSTADMQPVPSDPIVKKPCPDIVWNKSVQSSSSPQFYASSVTGSVLAFQASVQ